MSERPPLPPFTAETAALKVRRAEDAWNGRDPAAVSLAYTEDSAWRNRAEFFAGRDAIAAYLGDYMARSMGGVRRGLPRLLPSPRGHRFTDSPSGFVSLVNLASVQAVEAMVGAPVAPLRFRANLALDGLPAGTVKRALLRFADLLVDRSN